MLNPLLIIAVGILLGLLAGLGVGGGSLLVLWLTFIVGTPQITARAINLMFFIVAGGTVSFFRFKRGHLDIKTIIPAIISGCIAAGLCSWWGMQIDPSILKKIFGILLLITGVRELFYRPRKAK